MNDDGERGGTDGRSMQVLMPRHCACIPSLRSPNGTEHGIAVNPSRSGSQRPTLPALANLAVRTGSGCPCEGFKKARK